MTLTLLGMILLAASAALVATLVLVNDRSRREAIGRARGSDFGEPSSSVLIPRVRSDGLRQRLLELLPSGEGSSTTRERLLHAGHDGRAAVPLWFAIRLIVLGSSVLLAVAIAPRHSFAQWSRIVALAALVGALAPIYLLVRAVRKRRERVLRGLPDAMDLLVLCVEAGLGFDAAMLNVARDMRSVHPDLARELMLVNRKVNAGMAREEALRALYARTGVEELRVLMQNLIQADRLGTSIAKVLRVYADTLRRKRRQRAERRAATASLKMTFPLAALILPALFVVILGPALLRIFTLFIK
ncbi:MAG: type II secretion system F family protein [Gemmatimonadota bacterium]|nr:type II secretion system F family protein [Gemmatimonadota bacterium]